MSSISLDDYLEEVKGAVDLRVNRRRRKINISIEALLVLLLRQYELRFDGIFLENSKFKTFRKLLLYKHPGYETDFDLADEVYPYFLLCALFPMAQNQICVLEPLEDSITELNHCFILVRCAIIHGLYLLKRTRMDVIFNVLELSMFWALKFCKDFVQQTVIKHGRDDVQDKLDDKHHPFFEYILAEVYEKTLPIEVSEGMLSANVERCQSWGKLFEKFKTTSSIEEFISKSTEPCCKFCKTAISKWIGVHFVVLDSCKHIFCVEGFLTNLKSSKEVGLCPQCKIPFQAWGTSKEFKRLRVLFQGKGSDSQAQDCNISNIGVSEDLLGSDDLCQESPAKKPRIHPPETSPASGSRQSVYQSSVGASNAPQSSDPPCPSYKGRQPLCCEPTSILRGCKGLEETLPEVWATESAVERIFADDPWFRQWQKGAYKAFTHPVIKSLVNLIVCDIMKAVDIPSDCSAYYEYLLQMDRKHLSSYRKIVSLMKV